MITDEKQLAKTRFAEWLATAKLLHAHAIEADADFFAHLLEGERDEDMWRRGGGYATFADVLQSDCGFPTAGRYARYKEEIKRFGLEHVRKIGVVASESLLGIPEIAVSRLYPHILAADAILFELSEWRERNGTVPSARTVKTIIRKHYDMPRIKKLKTPEIERLINENKALRNENFELRVENARLKRLLGEQGRLVQQQHSDGYSIPVP